MGALRNPVPAERQRPASTAVTVRFDVPAQRSEPRVLRTKAENATGLLELYCEVMPALSPSDARQSLLTSGQPLIAGKGFSAVGLNEVLRAAGVPKGSFYHYFDSKEAYGEALLDSYFRDYLADLDESLAQPGTAGECLMNYWQHWQETQGYDDYQGKCLAVKLGAEVADLSEPMRLALDRGTSAVIDRLRDAIVTGVSEGSLAIDDDAQDVARGLYQLWLGASVMAKIVRDTQPFRTATLTTRQVLHLSR